MERELVPPVLPLDAVSVLLVLALMAAVIALSAWLRLGLTREFAVATVRAVVQLAAVGLAIEWVFRRAGWPAILALLAVMAGVAGWTGARRTGVRLPRLAPVLTLVLAAVTGLAMTYLTQAVIGVREWDPRYLIPLGGMLLGNSMTAATLAVERLVAELRQRGAEVEAYLALGASPARAGAAERRAAVRAAVTPTVNAMMIVGIVTLPGMMTGQMLGGTSPFQAALYQLMILFGIAFCAFLTGIVAVQLVYRRFFTPAEQLHRARLRQAG